MYKINEAVCQYLKGSPDGVMCGVVNRLIRSIEDADIRLCMNRHHEACMYYVLSLRELAQLALGADDSNQALGTL